MSDLWDAANEGPKRRAAWARKHRVGESKWSQPHCDALVLHAPEDGCEVCDLYPEAQLMRDVWGINYTGHHDKGKMLCPAEQVRPLAWINQWGGNTADGSGAGPYQVRETERIPTQEEIEHAKSVLLAAEKTLSGP